MRFRSEWLACETIITADHPITAGLSDGDLFQPFLLFDTAIDLYPSKSVILTDPPGRPPLPNATEPESEAPVMLSERSYVPWPSMIAMDYGAGRAVFGPNNGMCQPWGKAIDGDAYYARDVPNVLLLRTVEWLCKGSVTPPPPGRPCLARLLLAPAVPAPLN